MKVRETTLWNWLAPVFKGRQDMHVLRIEDHANVGTLDVNGTIQGVSFWIELKIGDLTDKGAVADVSKEQVQFMRRRCRAGGQAYLLLQLDDCRYLIPGMHDILLDLANAERVALYRFMDEAWMMRRPRHVINQILADHHAKYR